MRLTNKYFTDVPPKNIKKEGQEYYKNIEDKLSQLEDIEDELGIDLITLFKAFYRGFYYTGYEKIKHTTNRTKIVWDEGKPKIWSDYNFSNDLKNYGKTWALTKEELGK